MLFFYSYSSKSDAEEMKHAHFTNWLMGTGTQQDDTDIWGKPASKHSHALRMSQTVVASSSGMNTTTDGTIEINDSDSNIPAFEEDQKVERDVVILSPLKHGQWLTSKSIMKATHSSKAKVSQKPAIKELQNRLVAMAMITTRTMSEDEEDKTKKKQEWPTNNNLPPALLQDKKLWHLMILPTFINYIVSIQNPWMIPETRVITYLQPILNQFKINV
ncbi:hypothetical protein APHAL10511_006602 [Amanita phalloides]|nr:hypothetical protein APHAL10511_006602 [Amanita phalloides]